MQLIKFAEKQKEAVAEEDRKKPNTKFETELGSGTRWSYYNILQDFPRNSDQTQVMNDIQ